MQDDAKLIETAQRLRELLARASAGGDWRVYSEPEVGLPPSLFAGSPGQSGFDHIEPLRGVDLDLAAEGISALPALLDRLSTLSRDREDIRREAFDEAAKVVERASEYSFCCADGWTGGNVRKMLAERIRALKETSA